MSTRIIQVRPSRNPRWQKRAGWEVFEAPQRHFARMADVTDKVLPHLKTVPLEEILDRANQVGQIRSAPAAKLRVG